jgi:hypothetical protein
LEAGGKAEGRKRRKGDKLSTTEVYPWLCGIMMTGILLGCYTLAMNSGSAVIKHILNYAETNSIRSTLGFGFSGNFLHSLYFIDKSILENVYCYVGLAKTIDLVYISLFLFCAAVAVVGQRCKARILSVPVVTWLGANALYLLGLTQQALFYSLKYKLSVYILEMHPVIAVIVLAAATAGMWIVYSAVAKECKLTCLPLLMRNRKEMVEELQKEADADEEKIKVNFFDTKPRTSPKKRTGEPGLVDAILKFSSRFYIIVLSLSVLAFCMYTQVGTYLLYRDPSTLPTVTINNETYPTLNGVVFYVYKDLDLKHEHVALPIYLGLNLPMEFYSLKQPALCSDSTEKCVPLASWSSNNLLLAQTAVWALAAFEMLLYSICCCCNMSSSRVVMFRILLLSAALHFYTIFRQHLTLLLFANNDNLGLRYLVRESFIAMVATLVILAAMEFSLSRFGKSSVDGKKNMKDSNMIRAVASVKGEEEPLYSVVIKKPTNTAEKMSTKPVTTGGVTKVTRAVTKSVGVADKSAGGVKKGVRRGRLVITITKPAVVQRV